MMFKGSVGLFLKREFAFCGFGEVVMHDLIFEKHLIFQEVLSQSFFFFEGISF